MILSIKQINRIIMIVVMFMYVCFIPSIIFAQSTLLPERGKQITSDNAITNNSVSNGTQQNINTNDADKTSWASICIGVMLFSLFLIFLEIAIIPGFGICGIFGGFFLLVSLGLAYWKLSIQMAVIVTVAAVIGVVLLICFMIFVLPNTKLGQKMILSESATSDGSYALPVTSKYLGAEGVATSNLRPSGIAKIADDRVDVVTEGDFIEKGTKIKVIKTSAGRVVVAPVEE